MLKDSSLGGWGRQVR